MDRLKMNYLPLEKNVLFEIVEKHISIIESKKNYAKIIEKKNKMWTEIYTEFNAVQGTYTRTEKQIRLLWKNMKAKAKKDASNEKKQVKKKLVGAPWKTK